MDGFLSSLQQVYEVGTIIILILQIMEEVQRSEVIA